MSWIKVRKVLTFWYEMSSLHNFLLLIICVKLCHINWPSLIVELMNVFCEITVTFKYPNQIFYPEVQVSWGHFGLVWTLGPALPATRYTDVNESKIWITNQVVWRQIYDLFYKCLFYSLFLSLLGGIWTGLPTHNDNRLHKQKNFRTSQLWQKQASSVWCKVCGWSEHSAS